MLLRLSSWRPVSRCTDDRPEIGDLGDLEIEFLQVVKIFEVGQLRVAEGGGARLMAVRRPSGQLGGSAHLLHPGGNRLIGGVRGPAAPANFVLGERSAIEADLERRQSSAQGIDTIAE